MSTCQRCGRTAETRTFNEMSAICADCEPAARRLAYTRARMDALALQRMGATLAAEQVERDADAMLAAMREDGVV